MAEGSDRGQTQKTTKARRCVRNLAANRSGAQGVPKKVDVERAGIQARGVLALAWLPGRAAADYVCGALGVGCRDRKGKRVRYGKSRAIE
jgi:hypothetical protein